MRATELDEEAGQLVGHHVVGRVALELARELVGARLEEGRIVVLRLRRGRRRSGRGGRLCDLRGGRRGRRRADDRCADLAEERAGLGIGGRDAQRREEVPLRRRVVAPDLALEARRADEELGELWATLTQHLALTGEPFDVVPEARPRERCAREVAELGSERSLARAGFGRDRRRVGDGLEPSNGRRRIGERTGDHLRELERGAIAILARSVAEGVHGPREHPCAAADFPLAHERAAEAGQRTRLVGHVAQRAFEESARLAAEPGGEKCVGGATPDLVAGSRAPRLRFELESVGERVVDAAEHEATGEPLFARARERRTERDGAIEERRRERRIAGELSGSLERACGEERRGVGFGGAREGVDRDVGVTRPREELGAEQCARGRLGPARLIQHRERGLRALAGGAVDVGDAQARARMAWRAGQHCEASLARLVELACGERVVCRREELGALGDRGHAHGRLRRDPAARKMHNPRIGRGGQRGRADGVDVGDAHARFGEERARDPRGHVVDDEGGPMAARAAHERAHRLERDGDGGAGEPDAPRFGDEETQLTAEGRAHHVERERCALGEDRERGSRGGEADPTLRSARANQSAQPLAEERFEPGERQLERQSQKVAAAVTEARDATRDVDRELHLGEPHRELGDRERADLRSRGELEAEAVSTDRQLEARTGRRRRRCTRPSSVGASQRARSSASGAGRHVHDRGIVARRAPNSRVCRDFCGVSGWSPSRSRFLLSHRLVRSGVGPRVEEVLGPGSPMARMLPGYEERPGQLAMARAVERALAAERALFVEAGTGTGKTLAYLVPAVLSGKKVVISTATHTLQEQIFAKDLPLVATALAPFGVEVRAALMKGLSNYVCRRRLRDAVTAQGGGLLSAELDAILNWSKETETGDRSELVTLREGSPAWNAVHSSTDTRIGSPCSFYEECFVTRMKRAAEDAQIVVVNHHLYCADLALRRSREGMLASVLPAHDAVVFDEAHQLEDIATTFFGVRLSTGRFEALVRDVRRALAGDASAHKAPIERAAAAVETAAQSMFGALVKRAPSADGTRRAVARADLEGDVGAASAKLDDALHVLAAELAEGPPLEGAAIAERRARDLRGTLRSIERGLGVRRDRVVVPFDDDDLDATELDPPATVGFQDDALGHAIAWLDVRDRSVSLGASPIDLGRTFREALFGRVPTVVCTSATLAVAGTHVDVSSEDSEAPPPPSGGGVTHRASFHFFRARLGAPHGTEELVVASPFDFAAKVGLYVPRDLPEPNAPLFDARAAERARELIERTDGGAFVLCTSNRAMRAIHQALRGTVGKRSLYLQGDAPKHTLLARFRAQENAVLVATMSFWEGVDVPGYALRLVVIDKIPFAVPSDPIVAARCAVLEAEGGNPFVEYSVPMAAITLKQGFGRLVRSTRDAGIVAILDRRVTTRSYGKLLLSSLPPTRRLPDLDAVAAFHREVHGPRDLFS